jgi:hypothetical protein
LGGDDAADVAGASGDEYAIGHGRSEVLRSGLAAEIEFPFWNWRLNRMSETCRLNRRSNWQREDYIRKRRVMPVRSGLGKKGTLPPTPFA